jgi:PAS domain S-box-containing protein
MLANFRRSSRRDADGAIGKGRQLVADDLTRLIDSANAPIFGIDVHGMVTEWNQTACRLTGYTKAEVLGKHLVDTYITPEYQVAVNNVLQGALGGTETANFEFPMFSKTGHRVDVLLNASSRLDADGAIVGMVGVGQDITGMKAAEKERQLVADDLTRLIDSANAPIFGIDVHGKVTEWNQTAFRLTGYTKEEVLGKHLVDTYITPEYQVAVNNVLQEALGGTEMANFEFPLFGKTGQRVEVLLNASSRRDANGAIVGMVGVGQDITGMKAAEKDKQLVSDDLTRLIDSANAPIFGIDVHGKVTEWNQTACRLTGYTKAEVLGKHLVDTYITPEYQTVVRKVLEDALSGTEMANFEFPLFGKTGQRVEVLLNASSRRDADGAIVGMVGVGQDITGMKAAEKERQLVADDLTRLIDSANAPIVGIDVHGMVTEWNQTAFRLTGYTKVEVLGKHLVDTYITPEYQVAVRNVLQEALRGTEMANFEFPLFGKTGQRVDVLLNASSRRDAGGAIVGVVGVGQDITGMKAAEKGRQLVADDLTRLIDSANAPIFGIDVNGKVTEWNQTACRLTGYIKAEVLGKHLVDTYITPEYQVAVNNVLQGALGGTETANFEFPMFSKTGHRVDVLLNASSRLDADGAIVGMVGVGQDITGMKAAEKERKLVADDLTRLIDSANAPIFGIDVHGKVTEWNQTAFRLTGYTKEEVLGKHLVDTYITPEYQVAVNNVLQEALGGTEMANFEFPLFGKTGQRVEVLLNASSRRDANGSIVGMVGVGQDITGMKAAEKERQLVADDLTRLIDSANAPIFGIDVHGMVTEWNQTACRLTGYTKAEVLGKHLVDTYITPEYQTVVRKVLEDALSGTEMANFEFPLFGKTGQRVEVLLNASSRRDADGAIVGMVGVGQDITGMKAAEKERQLVADDLTRLIDSANAPIFGIDVHGMVTEWNQTACRLTGFTKVEVLGKHLVDTYITPEYQVAVRNVLQEALSGTEMANFEFPLFGKTGQRVEILLNASSRRDADGAIVGMVGVGQDITGMKAAEKERDQTKTDYLAFICHELRNPLNGINGLVDLCLGSDFLNKSSLMPEEFEEEQTEQLDLIKCIKTSSDLMKKVVDDVLDFSKLKANSMEMETVDFDIRQIIQDICREQVLAHNPTNQVQFLIDVDKSVPQHVNGDPTRFCQVVLNLLSNSMKFTVEGSVSLTVRCIPPPAHIEVSEQAQMVVVEATVKDTGLGMDPSYMSVLFKPYSQEKASVSRQHGGTGLGLPICKSIVERMGGSISVTSQLHQGSAFTFTAM